MFSMFSFSLSPAITQEVRLTMTHGATGTDVSSVHIYIRIMSPGAVPS
jgi:hypothetical protein